MTALRYARRALTTMVVALAGLALLAGVVVPRLAGATPYVVLTGSMAPRLPAGTLVVVRPVDVADLATGDVITFQLRPGEDATVTHRIVGVGQTVSGEPAFRTQGDANPVADLHAVVAPQVRGRLWYAVPGLGRVAALTAGANHQRITAGVAVALVAYAAWQVRQARAERHARRPAEVVA